MLSSIWLLDAVVVWIIPATSLSLQTLVIMTVLNSENGLYVDDDESRHSKHKASGQTYGIAFHCFLCSENSTMIIRISPPPKKCYICGLANRLLTINGFGIRPRIKLKRKRVAWQFFSLFIHHIQYILFVCIRMYGYISPRKKEEPTRLFSFPSLLFFSFLVLRFSFENLSHHHHLLQWRLFPFFP